VPGETTLPVLTGVCADIGDDQSAIANLSTFTAHLHFISELWKQLAQLGSNDSPLLVLIDEIGTGTEPGEGSAFAYGLLESLLDYPVKLAVTTHYDVLKTMAFERPDVKNVCLEFDQERLSPTFRILDNQPGQSFAFAIANRWGISTDVLDRASKMLGQEERKMGAILDELENLRREAELKRAEVANQAAELARIRERNEELAAELKLAKQRFAKHVESVKQQLERQIDELLSETKKKLRKKARQSTRKHDEFVKAASKSAGVARAQKAEVEQVVAQMMSALAIDQQISDAPTAQLEVGDHAIVISSGVKGEVLEIVSTRQEAVLAVMGKRMTVKLDKLKKAPEASQQQAGVVASYLSGGKRAGLSKAEAEYRKPTLTTSDTLDLHGQTTEEARESLDEFISGCLLAGVPSIRVMHGIGTGRLKTFVMDYLRRHKQVTNVRLAPVPDGGVGVTLADLR
jgi:DNA mismatch repair protein MutS2